MQFGPWKVVGELGRGGMGVVWSCKHVETGEFAAVKTIRHASTSAREGLAREIFALSQLDHPQIARFIEQGGDDEPWCAMEQVSGLSLRELLRGTQSTAEQTFNLSAPEPSPTAIQTVPGLPIDQALRLFAGLCHPLATLHGAGLVHRDLKTDNVLIRPDGVPVLLDLGIAVANRGRDQLLSLTGTTGTPSTMAPEQAAGELVDARCDLYALGCVAFEMLTGRPPFRGTTRQVVNSHLHLAPPRARELRRDVPERVDALLAALLSKDRRRRPAHALEVAAVLREIGVCAPFVEDLPQPAMYVYRPEIAGREAPLREVLGALESLSSRKGAAHAVVARSGDGKTRLLLEVARVARERQVAVLLLESQPSAGRGAASAPLRRFLEQLGRLSKRHRQPGWWGEWGSLLTGIAPSLTFVNGVRMDEDPMNLGARANRERLALAVSDVVLAAAAHTPILVLVDDLQWATPVVLRAVSHLVEQCEETSLSVVVAWRSEQQSPALAQLRGRLAVTVPPALTEPEVQAVVSDMLASAPPEGLVSAISQASSGSPLWVTELTAGLVQSGQLLRGPQGAWRVREEGLRLASSVNDLLAMRTTGLADSVMYTLHRAALQGREVHLGWLGLPAKATREGLRVLVQRGILRDDGRRLQFAHDAVREAVLSTVPDADRAEHHRALASALDTSVERRICLEELAEHLAGAGLRSRAAAVYAEAAEFQRAQIGDAGRLWEASLALLDTPTLASLERRRGMHLDLVGVDPTRAEVQLEQLQVESLQVGGPVARAIYLEALALSRSTAGDVRDAVTALHRALALRRDAGELDGQMRLYQRLAGAHLRIREFPQALCFLDQALEHAEGRETAELWMVIASTRSKVADYASAKEAIERAQALCRTPLEQAKVLDARVVIEPDSEVLGDLLLQLERVTVQIERIGAIDLASVMWQHVGAHRYRRGEYEAAHEAARRSTVLGKRLGARIRQAYGWYYQGLIERLGFADFDAAFHSAQQVVALSESFASPLDVADGYCELGHVALARGEDGAPWLALADQTLGTAIGDEDQLEVVVRLRLALRLKEQGIALFRGQAVEDLTPGQRERAVRDGLVSA